MTPYLQDAVLEHLSRSQVRQTFEVNLLCGLQLISEITPIMRKQGGGRVINMSSLTSRTYAPLAVPYAATKGAMEMATHCLRLELAPWNIHFSLVIPGFVDTPAFDLARDEGEELRNDASNPYQGLMLNLSTFADAQLENNASSPESVAGAVVKAALADRPKCNYFVPASSAIFGLLAQVLPLRWMDWLLTRLYGTVKWSRGQ